MPSPPGVSNGAMVSSPRADSRWDDWCSDSVARLVLIISESWASLVSGVGYRDKVVLNW